jgi:hypothetical protein
MNLKSVTHVLHHCYLYFSAIAMGLTLGPRQTFGEIREEASSWIYGLTPMIIVDQTAKRCAQKLTHLAPFCEVPNLGTLTFNRLNGQLVFKASRPLTLNGLGWEGDIKLADAQNVLSNGFHSWSHSGIIAAGPAVSPKEVFYALDIRHDEFRDGRALSWEYGLISNKDHYLFAGATSALKWKSWVQFVRRDQDIVSARIISGGAGEALVVNRGESIEGETWRLHAGPLAELGDALEEYGNSLAGPRSRRSPPPGPPESSPSHIGGEKRLGSISRIGWNSWYNLWNKVDHQSFVENVHLAAPYLAHQFSQVMESAEIPVAVLDDGWSMNWGDWRANEKFPEGLPAVVKQIENASMEAGIWIAPWLVAVDSPLAKEKPSWFVATEDFTHPSGKYKILDPTHPEVAEHLKSTIRSLVDQGFRYLKLDFLYTGAFEGRRYSPVTGIQSFVTGMRIIREAAGPGVSLASCGAPGLAVRPFVDSWRTGPDIAYQYPSGRPAWADVALQIQNLSARWFLCGSMRCDIDPLLVRGPRRIEEVQAALWAVALGAGGFFVSDDLRQLEPNRKIHPLSPMALEQAISESPARPDPILPIAPQAQLLTVGWMDRVFDHNPIRPPVKWALPSGKKVLINTTEQTIKLDGIELPKRQSYVE